MRLTRGLFHVSCILSLLPAAGPSLAGPKISVDRKVHDFGEIPEGIKKEVSGVFTVKNSGDDTLRIKGVRPG